MYELVTLLTDLLIASSGLYYPVLEHSFQDLKVKVRIYVTFDPKGCRRLTLVQEYIALNNYAEFSRR